MADIRTAQSKLNAATAPDNTPPGVPMSEPHADRKIPSSEPHSDSKTLSSEPDADHNMRKCGAVHRPQSATSQNLSSKKDPVDVSRHDVLHGHCGVDDGPWTFFKKAFRYLAHVKLVAIAIALTLIPLIWYHQYMHVTYLEELSTFTNATTTERHALIGFNGMFKPSRPLFWMWTATFAGFGTLNLLSVSVGWIYVISGYQPLNRGILILSIGTFVILMSYAVGGYLLTALEGLEIPQLLFNAPAFLSAAAVTLLCAMLARQTVGLPSLPKVLCSQGLTLAVVFYVYTEWLPTWFLATESDFLRLLIRVIIHPILMECIVGTTRVASLFYPAELDQCTLVVFMFPAYTVANLLGRFLVATSSTFGWALATTICLSLQQVATRMTASRRDYFYLRLLFNAEKAESMAYSKRAGRLKADILTLDAITEELGILVAPAIIYFYQLASTRSEVGAFISTGPLLTTMLMQFLFEALTDFGPTLFVIMVDGRQHLWAGKQRKAKKTKRVVPHNDRAFDIASQAQVALEASPRQQALQPLEAKGVEPADDIEAGSLPSMPDHGQISPLNQRTPVAVEQSELADLAAQVGPGSTMAALGAGSAYQRDKVAWETVGRDKTNGTLHVHHVARNTQTTKVNPTVAERVFSCLCLAAPKTYATKIKTGHVSTINAWYSTFPGYGIVFWLYYVTWGAYFLRYFFFPMLVICAVNRGDGQWPEWQFRSCSIS